MSLALLAMTFSWGCGCAGDDQGAVSKEGSGGATTGSGGAASGGAESGEGGSTLSMMACDAGGTPEISALVFGVGQSGDCSNVNVSAGA